MDTSTNAHVRTHARTHAHTRTQTTRTHARAAHIRAHCHSCVCAHARTLARAHAHANNTHARNARTLAHIARAGARTLMPVHQALPPTHIHTHKHTHSPGGRHRRCGKILRRRNKITAPPQPPHCALSSPLPSGYLSPFLPSSWSQKPSVARRIITTTAPSPWESDRLLPNARRRRIRPSLPDSAQTSGGAAFVAATTAFNLRRRAHRASKGHRLRCIRASESGSLRRGSMCAAAPCDRTAARSFAADALVTVDAAAHAAAASS